MSQWQAKKISPSKTIKTNRPRNGNGKGIGKWILSALVLVGIFYIFSFVLPRVDIMLIPESRLVRFEDTVVLSFNENIEIDEALTQKILTGKKISVSGEIDKIFETTGKKDIGDRARGEVVFSNTTGLSQLVLVEDGLQTSDGMAFAVTATLTVPAATVSAEGDIVPGQITAQLVALEAGEDKNIKPQKIFINSVPPERQLKIFAQNKNSFTGGTSEIVQVVSEEDIDKSKNELAAKLTDQLLLQIADDLPSEQTFMIETFKLLEEEYISEQEVNLEATEFNYSLKARGEVVIYNNENLNQLVQNTLREQLNPNESFLSDTPSSLEVTEIKNDPTGNLLLSLEADWLVSQPIDTDNILEEILGEREADSRRIILKNPAIADVRFDWSFAINKRIPNVASHVNLLIMTQ